MRGLRMLGGSMMAATVAFFAPAAAGFPNGTGADFEVAADDAPWFTNVAIDAGLAEFPAKRTKWLDLDDDGWVDMLLFSPDGREWQADFLRRNGLGAELREPVAKADWHGTTADFALGDLDGNGTITPDELREAARRHLFWALKSVPAGDDSAARNFVDVTAESGIHGRPIHLLVAGDVDGDGDTDLYASGYATQNPGKRVEMPATILLNDGTGKFRFFDQETPAESRDLPAGPNAVDSTVCAATVLDFDADGRLDLFVGSWYVDWGNSLDSFADRLYKGLGDGRFDDVTARAGMMLKDRVVDALPDEDRAAGRVRPEYRDRVGRVSHRPTYGVAGADWDGDGDTDLFAMAYGRQWNLHWRNNGDGTFTEIAEATHFDGDAIRHGQYPGDNPTRRRAEMPFRSNGNTFDCAFGDYNNDGHLDAVLGEFTHAWAGESSDVSEILTNTGRDGQFAFRRETGALERIHTISNWNHGDYSVAWIDLENDGFLDLLISAGVYPDRNVLEIYRQTPGTGRFERVTEKIGLNWPDSAQLSLADYDRDGDVDILVGNMPHETRASRLPRATALFRNDIANRSGNRFLSMRLEGKGADRGANRQGIGARILVTANGRTQIREIGAGGGHVGHQDHAVATFGLGTADTIERLEIRWGGAANTVDVFENLDANQFLLIREGRRPIADRPRR